MHHIFFEEFLSLLCAITYPWLWGFAWKFVLDYTFDYF